MHVVVLIVHIAIALPITFTSGFFSFTSSLSVTCELHSKRTFISQFNIENATLSFQFSPPVFVASLEKTAIGKEEG